MSKFRLFKDLLCEEKDGKYSSKKIWGTILMSEIAISYILDGTQIYEVNAHLFDAALMGATALLGLSIFANMKKIEKGSSNDLVDSEDEQF